MGAMVGTMLLGCAATIPPQLAPRVSSHLSFRDVRHAPDAYKGSLVVLGGTVTQIKATDEGYLVTVRDIPLDGSSRYRPAINQPSDGTFVLKVPRHELPRNLRAGAEVTIVGEVLGTGEPWHDGQVMAVPLLAEQYIHVWGPSWWPRFQINIWGTASP